MINKTTHIKRPICNECKSITYVMHTRIKTTKWQRVDGYFYCPRCKKVIKYEVL